MNKKDEEVVLGKDATELFKAKTRKDTAVVSVRLSWDDIKRLETIGSQEDKTISQVIRESISAYLNQPKPEETGFNCVFARGPYIEVAWGGGVRVSTGTPSELELVSEAVLVSSGTST